MAIPTSSRRGKPARLLRKGTATTKSHRFEPFSQRVVKLKIDPIHRSRRTPQDGDDANSTSYFRSSLEHWIDLNLSENFTRFAGAVNPLCESLPQILYYEDRIMELLVEYIEKRDELCMEPLLDLVAQFARDLGQRFEKHFALTVTLVAKVAATHSSIEVIEWSFTCLAWIFKFLARLLVPDLRQLLSIMSPYLGKEKQKHFVSRFAAESMSFLIRKAALVYYKNQAPLDKAVSFLIHDLTAVTDAAHIAMYQDGLMAMLSDSIKGVKAGLYSNGTDIIQALIRAVLAVHGPGKESARRVLDGVIINLIHSTTSDTFTPVLDTVCNTFTGEGTPALDATRYEVFTRLLFLVVVTRKGSRIHDWKTVHAALVTVLDANLGSLDSHAEATPMVLSTVANAVQSSPMDDLLPSMRPLLSRVAEPALAAFFLSFCTLSAELGLERFQSVVLPHLQKFITSCWQEHEAEICITLPHLLSISAVTFKSEKKGSISLPANWVAHIESKLLDTSPSEDDIPILHAFASFGLADVLTSGSTAISQRLHSLIRAALQSPADLHHNLRQFALGSGFSSYCGLASKSHSIDCGLWSLIEAHGSDHAREPAFLRAVLDFIDRCPLTDKPTATQLDAFANSLITNLSSPSSQLRILSLRLLRVFSTWVGLQDEGCVAICLEIESSDLTLETERQLNMQLRKLAIKYHEFANKTWLSRLLPTYCFGILSKQLGTLVDTACDALETICDVKEGETWVSDLAVRLFTTSEQAVQSDRVDLEEESHDDDVVDRRNYSEYECFNVAATERRLERVFSPARDCQTRLAHAFTLAHAMPDALPQSARSKALKVLNAVPQVAEKHSRQIVPHFLAWAAHDDDIDESPAGDEEPEEPNDSVACYTTGSLWSLTDRKTMLAVLGKFVNPKVLYQASEAREALLGLLTSGDPETQKLALKALFTWKSSSIHPYEANLLNILDEKRLKDELTVFVHVDDDSSTIEVQHRPELMPILFRLLYGRVVSRQGSRTNRGTQEGRRKMIIRTISQLPDFEQFLRIAFGPLSDISVTHASNVLEKELMGTRKQFGLLRMIATMLDTLGVKMRPHAQQLLDVVLYCLIRACRCIGQSNAEHTEALLRSVRQTGVKCLDLLFATSAAVDWPYVTLIYTEVVRPRLPTLAIETAQGVSGLLQLFKTWSSDLRSCVYFTQGDGSIIRELINVLAVDSARDEVKGFVMQQIFSNILDYADGRKPKHLKTEGDLDSQLVERVRAEVLAPYIEALLIQLEQLLRSQLRKQMTVPAIETLSRLAPFVQSSGETTKLVRTTTYLLQQPADRIPPKAKSGILDVLRQFLPIYDPQGNDALNEEIFQTLASLFDYFKDEPNRKTVSLTLSALAEHDKSLAEVASLCEGLNSLSQKKLESVDYERRLAAFRTINEEGYARFDARQWRPILYNCLYHVKDREELAIRSSAAHGLRRFIERSVPSACQDDPAFAALLTDTLLPALRAGVKLPHEIVRVEFVQLMGYAVAHHPEQDSIHDMEPLLAGGDEEASFFTNVLHIQQHRRTRALRRLASESTKGTLRAANISTFFLPLIEHYVFDQAEDENAHNLAAEAVAAIGQLSANLEWSQFRAIYRRYRSYVQTKAGLEKNVLRLLGRMTDCLADALKPSDGDTAMVDVGSESEVQPFAVSGALARSLPGVEKVRLELKSNFIPYLTKFTHLKDESEVNLRLPAAVIAVKMIHLLSEEESGALLPAVLLDVSNVLRSRSQESRDAARKTLSDIALILGASYFGHILKELRSTLQRGYQLHVLSYTVHSMLVNTSEHFKPGDLDNDLELMADIVIEDIFGTVGQEKEAEEYISKMKEVKSSKSFDSMELLAKNASITRLAALVRPIQLLLQEKLTSRIVLKVDELLRRIGIGLIRNPGAESRDVLVFSYEVIKEANQQNDLPVVSEIEDREQKRRARYLINLRSARNNANKGATTAYTHKLARFGLDVLRAVLNKFNSLLTVENITGFLPVINDALVQAHEEVKLSAMRALSVLIKLPMSQLDEYSDVYLAEAIKIIRESPNTNTEAAQVALKFIATILRERKKTQLKDSQLAYLLKRISTDIDDPDRQGIAFNFIRAVMSRKFMVAELYQVVDSVAAMMVTNQTRSARDLARGVYVHFTIEYPQAKSRWNKQLAFLAKNMDYKHTEGRQSVMEAIHMLLTKLSGEPAQDMVGCFFVPLVMAMTNDESPECREMAGSLLREVLERADSDQLKSITTPLHAWLEQVDNPVLTSTGLQTFRLFFESERSGKEKEIPFVLGVLPRIFGSAESREEGAWEVLYYALQLFSKLCQLFPKRTLVTGCAPIWARVVDSLFFPHTWIRSCAANLVGTWFADVARTNAASGLEKVPLSTSSGLNLDTATMLKILRASFGCLRSAAVTDELATQVVRNLVFVGRCCAQNGLEYTPRQEVAGAATADDDNEDDDSSDDEDEASGAKKKTRTAIEYIFQRATGILRRETISTRAEALVPKTACMKLIAALCAQLTSDQLRPSLQTVLRPLILLTDPSIPAPHSLDERFNESYKALVSNCQEILDMLQKKFGTTDFVAEMTIAKERVVARREERRVKRKIEAIADPAKSGAEKRRKHDRKREKRKEKGHSYQDRRRGW